MSKLSASAMVFIPPETPVGFIPTRPQPPDEEMPDISSPLQRRELQEHHERCQSTIHELSDTINRLQNRLDEEKLKSQKKETSNLEKIIQEKDDQIKHIKQKLEMDSIAAKRKEKMLTRMRETISSHYEEIKQLESMAKDYQKQLKKRIEEQHKLIGINFRLKEKNENMENFQNRFYELRNTFDDYRAEELLKREGLVREIDDLKQKARDNDLWMKNTLCLKWIIDEMKKVGAIRLPDHDWAVDMAHDLEFSNPEDPHRSVFRDKIPYSIYREALPNASDAGIQFVEEETENRLIAELSREAQEFSSQLGSGFSDLVDEDHDRAVEIIIKIQSIVRGFISRQRIMRTFGKTPEERSIRMNAAILIQSIYRGFSIRGHRIFNPHAWSSRESQYPTVWYRDYLDQLGPSHHAIWSHRMSSWRGNQNLYSRTIKFFNTGNNEEKYSYCWFNPSTRRFGPWKIIAKESLNSGTSLSTYVGHWIKIKNWTTDETFWVRVNFSALKVSHFDLNTRINISTSLWEIQNRRRFGGRPRDHIIRREDVPVNRIAARICGCQNCQRRRLGLQNPENDDETRLQMAIQMSIESAMETAMETPQNTIRWTNDIEDYNISNMFHEPDETTLIRQRQDQEYARAEEIDLARQRLAEDVDTNAIREARLARFTQ